jgi:hypothetical protein
MGFGLLIGFIEFLQNVTTSKDYVLNALHTVQFTESSQLAVSSILLVTASSDVTHDH